jgi:zinc/manganese transport system substrate-binding protein
LKDADVFVQVGLDLEVGWVPPLLETARNSKIYFGGPGYVDASRGVSLLEVPSVDPARMRAEGDIHVFGNPHYWLDPENGKVIAKNIADGLSSIMPTKRTEFADNADQFSARIDSALQVWQQIMAPHKGAKIVAYHNSWPYFEKRFGIEIIAFIEPKPGIPPPPSHLMSVIRMAQDQAVKAIIISPYFDDKPAKSIAKRSNAEVVYLSPSVGATNEVKTYFDLFQSNVTALAKALEK